jgi:hypothetical protein
MRSRIRETAQAYPRNSQRATRMRRVRPERELRCRRRASRSRTSRTPCAEGVQSRALPASASRGSLRPFILRAGRRARRSRYYATSDPQHQLGAQRPPSSRRNDWRQQSPSPFRVLRQASLSSRRRSREAPAMGRPAQRARHVITRRPLNPRPAGLASSSRWRSPKSSDAGSQSRPNHLFHVPNPPAATHACKARDPRQICWRATTGRPELSACLRSYHRYPLDHPGDRPMLRSENLVAEQFFASELFMRHAAECKQMANASRDAETRKVWIRMAERWARCAELARHPQDRPPH